MNITENKKFTSESANPSNKRCPFDDKRRGISPQTHGISSFHMSTGHRPK